MPSLTYAVHQDIYAVHLPPLLPSSFPPSITSFSLSPFFTCPFLLASFSFVQFPSSFPYSPLYFPSSFPSLPRSLPSLLFSYRPSLFHLPSFTLCTYFATLLHFHCPTPSLHFSLPFHHPFHPTVPLLFTSILPPLPS